MNAVANLNQLAAPTFKPGDSLLDIFAAHGGLVDIPNDIYHADRSCYSSTALKLLHTRTPAHFHHNLNHSRTETPLMFQGTAIHSRLLEPELFVKEYIAALDGNKLTKAYQEFKKNATGMKILSRDQMIAVEAIQRNVMAHSTARALIMGGVCERTFIWQDEETGIWLKIRPDCLNFDLDSGICLDVKSTDDASPWYFTHTCKSMHYDFSAAMYLEGLRVIFKRDFDFAFLVVERDAPYQVAVRGAPLEMIERGRRHFRQALRKLRHCLDTDEWPGYQPDGGYEVIEWPKYAY